MIIEEFIERMNKHKTSEPKVLELSTKEYGELMVIMSARETILDGNSGYDVERGCYMCADFEIRRKAG